MDLPNGSIAPFDGEGTWLRCALHAHTTESDGWLTPDKLRRYHAVAGYDVLAITDHDCFTGFPRGAESQDNLLLIGGSELSLTAPQSGGPLHVLALGIESQPAVGLDATLAEATAAVRASGGLAFVAHPVWSGLRTEEVGDLPGVAGIEIYNAGCEVEQGRGHANAHWDIWLAAGLRVTAIATDDLHYPGFEAFRAWTMVRAADRTREAVLAALAAGRFYSTCGPRITELSVENGALIVRTTPARTIAALANPHYGAQINAGRHELTFYAGRLRTSDNQGPEGIIDGELLTGAIFRGAPGVRYARIVVTDDLGRMAWTNPIWFD